MPTAEKKQIRTKKPDIERMKAEKDIKGLVAVLDHEDINIREGAVYALGELGGDVTVDVLIRSLKSPNPIVRDNSAYALGAIHDKRAVEPLINAIRYVDENGAAHIQESVIDSLGEIGDPRAAGPLIRLLNEDYTFSARIALTAIGNEAVKALVAAIKNEEIQDRVCDVLIDIGSAAVDELAEALNDADEYFRSVIVYTLGEIGQPECEKPLKAALNDKSEDVRDYAALALRKIKY